MRKEGRKVIETALVAYWNWNLVDVYISGAAKYIFVLPSMGGMNVLNWTDADSQECRHVYTDDAGPSTCTAHEVTSLDEHPIMTL